MNNDGLEIVANSKMVRLADSDFAFYGTLTPDGTVISLVGKLFERAGLNPNALIGQLFSETVFWQSSEGTSNRLIAATKEASLGKAINIRLVFRVSAKENITIELNLFPLFENEETLKSLFFYAVETPLRDRETEFHRQENEMLLFAAKSAEIGFWNWNLITDESHASPKCKKLFEIEPTETLSLNSIISILHHEDKIRFEQGFSSLRRSPGQFKLEFRVIYSNGNIEWISGQGRSFLRNDGILENVIWMFQSITDKKIAAQQMSAVYEREKKLREELEETSRTKDFFLAAISHELRTPLNAILGWTKILLTKELDEETRRRALETVERSARSQVKLLDDLLDSSRVASGRLKLEFREINIHEIVKTVLNLQNPTADSKQIEMTLGSQGETTIVFADALRIQQVISNLVSNALKFTAEGGKITVRITTEDDQVVINVTDTGQGISSEVLPNIFRQFRQGDEETGDKGGLGLGLSISKILVEKHKGNISAASGGVGLGATFTVKLPLVNPKEKPAKTEIPPKIDQQTALAGLLILSVEDEPDSREVLQLYLEQNGAKVKSAETGATALEYLQNLETRLPDVILSDLAMPGISGYEMLKALRKLAPEGGGKIPAIALSAFTSADNREKALKSGFQKYHTKPFDPDALISDILELVRS